MTYLTQADEIRTFIDALRLHSILWLDTEVADWQISCPNLSLIQVLSEPGDRSGEATYLLDVLDQPGLIRYFVDRIMTSPQIEKVFHNASYDVQFLGKTKAKNVTCTLAMARKIPLQRLGTANRKLKTLARDMCHFRDVDEESQASDWRRRPLSAQQLQYARMDTVYLAHVHHQLLGLRIAPDGVKS
jgi:S-DNA-T family DNA segregation ATPase FtsK/SpoIIIE